MFRVRRAAWALLLAMLACLVVGQGSASADDGPTWTDSGTSWTGHGGVFVPGGEYVSGAHGCSGDCDWSVMDLCPLSADRGCNRVAVCGFGSNLLALMHAGVVATTFCAGPSEAPISVEELGQRVADRVRQAAPAIQIKYQPPGGALTQLPTVFRSGQPKSLSRDDSIAGFQVHFDASASWVWSWGDGKSTSTTDPGGKWPDMSVAHTYRQSGRVNVEVKTTWDATYSVNGQGSFPVQGDAVTQTDSVGLRVKQARAVLQ